MTTTTDPEDDGLAELRAFARQLFGRPEAETTTTEGEAP